ncbi:MAG: bifunctional diaminohydroxyphosphoribosylaminopyrimidine deaminase/5-amino-6-(5-phosphoribosylamino)uracil reductase RibD [Gammaproteobacteria bacterium]
MLSSNDEVFLRRAVKIAENGLFSARPNPRVGCVIVKNGRVIGEGWHVRAGEAHAEINALASASDSTAGADVYVSLEPCSHTGRTPPCVDALIEAGVARVITATTDPNPKVYGEGVNRLRASGIEVVVAESDFGAAELNNGFFKRMLTGRPQIRLKIAATLDGRTAAHDGSSRWITGAEARADVHRLRARSCAVVTGIGTVLADDPRLTARVDGVLAQPIRVIVQGRRRIPMDARLFNEPGRIVLVQPESDCGNEALTDDVGVAVLPGESGSVDLEALIRFLSEQECNEVLVESGPKLSGAFLAQGLVDEIWVYQSAGLLGDRGRAMFELDGVNTIADQMALHLKEVTHMGEDLRLIYTPRGSS